MMFVITCSIRHLSVLGFATSSIPVRWFSRAGGISASAATKTTTEIERKFLVNPQILEYCKAYSLSEKQLKFTDTYYDDKLYSLTTKDMWLRERNNNWELKVPIKDPLLPKSTGQDISGIDRYLEIRNVHEICQCIAKEVCGDNVNHKLLSVPPESTSLSSAFLESFAGLKPFVRLQSERKRFLLEIPQKNKNTGTLPLQQTVDLGIPSQRFHVDVDEVQYDPQFIPYDNREQSADLSYAIGEVELVPPITESSENSMRLIFAEMGIDPAPVRGKLLEYIFRFYPNHYQALHLSGQLQSKGIK
jgi:hypothetical protein